MKRLILILAFSWGAYAQYGPPICNVSNAQIPGYVLTATNPGKLCAWQAPTGGGGGGAVTSVFGRSGVVIAVTGDYSVNQVTGAAPLFSPTFTGIPTAPTAAPGTNTTQLATTAFVTAAIGAGGCPTCLLGTPTNHGVFFGGTGQTGAFSAVGTSGQALLSGGASANGAYGALNLAGGTSIVTGILPALNLPTASNVAKGIVQGDGSTITITGGVESCTTATTSQIGCVKPDGTTITISGGIISSGGPSGPAGGVLSGTYPNPSLAAVTTAGTCGDSTHVCQITTNTGGQVTTKTPVTITGAAPTGAAGGVLNGSYPNPTLANVATPGTCGDSSHVCQITINAGGQTTTASPVSIAGAPPTGAAGGALAGTYPNPTLATVATGATCGDSTHVCVTTFNNAGQITTGTPTLITGAAPTGAAGGALAGTYPNPSIASVTSPVTGCGDATHVCQLNINAAGQTTSATSVAITGGGGGSVVPYVINAATSPQIILAATHGQGINPITQCFDGAISAGATTGIQVVCQWSKNAAGDVTVAWSGTIGSIEVLAAGPGPAGGGGGGTVTLINTTGPLGGGPITSTGTITCTTCGTVGSAVSTGGLMFSQGGNAMAGNANIVASVSGNLSGTGFYQTTKGYVLPQGPDPGSFSANAFHLIPNPSIPAAYRWMVPSADANGVVASDGAGTPGHLSIIPTTGTGNIMRASAVVTGVNTSSPIAGGFIGGTGTISCPTCVTTAQLPTGALAPLTLGSASFTGNNPLTTWSAGAFNNVNRYSSSVNLLGSSASSQLACDEHFHPYATDTLAREGAGVFCAITSSGDTAWETDGIISMVIAKNPASFPPTVGSVGVSSFVIAAATGANVWNYNSLIRDYDNENPAINWAAGLFGNEMDASIANTGSTYSAINLNVELKGTRASYPVGGIVGLSLDTVGGYSSGTKNYFDYGYISRDGAANVAIDVGRAPALIGINSQFVNFHSGSTGQYLAKFYADSQGSLVMQTDTAVNANRVRMDRVGTLLADADIRANVAGSMMGFVPGGNGAAFGFNVVDTAGTYNAIISSNRAGYMQFDNTGAHLVVTSGTQTAGSPLSTAITAIDVDLAGKITVPAMRISSLPTNCSGQPSGTLWNNSNVVNVCP